MISRLGKTLAAQSCCSKLSRKRFSAMALEDVRYAAPKSAAVGVTADIRTTPAGLENRRI